MVVPTFKKSISKVQIPIFLKRMNLKFRISNFTLFTVKNKINGKKYMVVTSSRNK
ncbi:hypothetical protein LEP1GSC083_4788 [Leptospira interrogans serovar Pyrogenes str. L0374]|uniref:Uncharacterized protein n=1 Tax=Leptospira interrogans serovar Pyrogenes str. L0374 TaxID=1049928 RepID=M6KEM7_LEPIR|nr:hypothetical protein LEP1GSC083_4788 [Leptospira interrogans serovar Pyrogenes str. L0374]